MCWRRRIWTGIAAYVSLTRHPDRMEQHYARENFADQAQPARVLSRERAKGTSLDYPDRGNAAHAGTSCGQ